jgi:rifampicin phosphotransferase
MNVTIECGDQQFSDRLRSAICGIVDQSNETDAPPQLIVETKFNQPKRIVTIRRGDAHVTLQTGLPISRHLDPTLLAAVAGLAPEVSISVVHADDLIAAICDAARDVCRALHADGGDLSDTQAEDVRAVVAGTVRASKLLSILNQTPDTTNGVVESTENRFGWTATEALVDMARGVVGRAFRNGFIEQRSGAIPVPRRVPPSMDNAADNGVLENPGGAHRGEFDGQVDPRFPVYTATNAGEAFPGALTPMTIDVQLRSLRYASTLLAELFGFGPIAEREWQTRENNVFGHRLYLNASSGIIAGRLTPGWDEASAKQHALQVPDDVDLLPLGMPDPAPTGLSKIAYLAKLGVRMVGMFRGYRAEVALLKRTELAERIAPAALGGLTDAQLTVRLRLAVDRHAQAWAVAAIGVVLASATAAPIQKKHGPDALSRIETDPNDLPSAQSMIHVLRLADILQGDPKLAALAADGNVAGACESSPALSTALASALSVIGHRGPGEGELANPTFADRPEQLLIAASRRIDRGVVAHTETRLDGKSVQRAVRYMQQREQARTIAVRWTDQIRRIEQELGRRAVAAGTLREVSDVFYLTVDELLADRHDALTLVDRRRTERERLSKLVAPVHFSRYWEPTAPPDELATGEKLIGLGVSAGVVEGIVRIIRTPDEADLDPGEVLVATVTDVGYTPLFAVAAAVVTDVGGMMSHASIVAREFGIPCVVHTQNATTRLRDGQRIRVDGTAGTVEVLTN